MRKFRFLLVAVAFMMSMSGYPGPSGMVEEDAVPYEIGKLLEDNDLAIEEDLVVRVIFSLSDEKRIQIYSVSSPDEEVNEFVKKRLQDRKLYGKKWHTNKRYELPVKLEALK